VDRSFFHFVTIHACDKWTDGQTDRQTEFSSLDRICISCSAVIKRQFLRRRNMESNSRAPAFKMNGKKDRTLHQENELLVGS